MRNIDIMSIFVWKSIQNKSVNIININMKYKRIRMQMEKYLTPLFLKTYFVTYKISSYGFSFSS